MPARGIAASSVIWDQIFVAQNLLIDPDVYENIRPNNATQ
jgi:hypothetical protein